MLLGSTSVKAVRKTLMKLALGDSLSVQNLYVHVPITKHPRYWYVPITRP